MARILCRLGALDDDLAEHFNVRSDVIALWQEEHPEFFDGILEGTLKFNCAVERSLAQRCLGYTRRLIKLKKTKKGIVELVHYKYVPPQVSACIFWLINQAPNEWRK